MRHLVPAIALVVCAGNAPAATTIPTSPSFAVSATVTSGCWVVGNPSQTTGIGFGLLDFGTHSATVAGSFNAVVGMSSGSLAQIQCTSGVTVTMTLDAGQNALGNQRRMKLTTGNSYLLYTLSTAPTGGTTVVPGVGMTVNASAGPTTLPIYGIATSPGTGLPAGQYTDVVQVVFSW